MNNLKKPRTWLLIITGTFLTWIIFNTVQIHLFSKQYYDTKSDVAIVLGAGSNQGNLSPVFTERVSHSIKLFKEGKVEYIIFTGGFGKDQTISDSQSAKNYALANGIPETKIFIEQTSTVTFENLYRAKEIMDEENFNSALIVSDPYHMKRAMAMSDAHGISGKPSPTPTTMYRSWSTKLQSLAYESFYYNIDLMIGRF